MSIRSVNWDQAACAGLDPKQADEIFFPESASSSRFNEARTYCVRCPVADDCLQQALQGEDTAHEKYRYGMFGGTTPRQRYQMHKKAQQ